MTSFSSLSPSKLKLLAVFNFILILTAAEFLNRT